MNELQLSRRGVDLSCQEPAAIALHRVFIIVSRPGQ